MVTLNLENIWERMGNNNYEIVTEIDNDMLCLLCKRLLINARCAPCGCRFCFTCISGFLDGENNICPGNTEECKLEILNLDRNIAVDHPMNAKLLKLQVKCPEMSCEFVDEIKKMENHSRTCKYRSVACPYSNIGCDTCNISQDNVAHHLQFEILNHTKLLMDFIGNFNNEMDIMKANDKLQRTEINELKLIVERNQEEIAALQCQSAQISLKIDQLNAENTEIRGNMNKLISDDKMNQITIRDLQEKYENQYREIGILDEEMPALRNVDRRISDRLDGLQLVVEGNQRAIQARENNLQQQIAQCATRCQQAENKEKELIDKIDEMKNKQEIGVMEMTNEINKSIQNIDRKLLEMAANQNQQKYEFIWKLDKFSDKMADAKKGINATIYSESFLTHKNGYKICLRVDPNGNGVVKGTHLSVFFCLMKGEMDGILQWPFRHSVTITLINQCTRLAQVSKTAKYADYPNYPQVNQPTDRNIAYEFDLIRQTELSSNPDLIRNNEIFIKCSVDIQS